jgi:NADPH:quinone reductase-like Zn-dependent oxidoreductase
MLAITRKKYGPPTVLEVKDVEEPSPGKGELLVKVFATTINRTDCAALAGTPRVTRLITGWPRPRKVIMGTDLAGRVVAVGEGVKRFEVGDDIWGLNDVGFNSQASYTVISEKEALAKIPEGFSYHEAVSCAEGAHYAYNFINKVALSPGQKVMLNGATGAIGSAALQLLRHYGAQVVATATTPHLDLIKSLGAERVIDFNKADFTLDEEKFDYVFDTVGKSSFAACKRLLVEGGVYISSELGKGAENLYLPLITKIKGKKRVIFPIPANRQESIDLVHSLMKQGAFQAVIDREYSIDQAVEAYTYVSSGQKKGNVILRLKK